MATCEEEFIVLVISKSKFPSAESKDIVHVAPLPFI